MPNMPTCVGQRQTFEAIKDSAIALKTIFSSSGRITSLKDPKSASCSISAQTCDASSPSEDPSAQTSSSTGNLSVDAACLAPHYLAIITCVCV